MATKHNHPANFGKRVDGCPRCLELTNGAKPIRWHSIRKESEAQRTQAIRNHNCQRSGCGVVCTAFDW